MAFASIIFQICKLSSIFWPKHMLGQIFKLVNTYFIFYIYPYNLLILACMFGGCSFLVTESCGSCWYAESSSYLHSQAWRDDESCLSLEITIWFFPYSFLYTLNAGMSNTIIWLSVVKSQQRVSHYIAPFLFPATLTLYSFISYHPLLCLVSFYSVV